MKLKPINKLLFHILLALSLVFSVVLVLPSTSKAANASLSMSPNSGSYEVGSTFDVSVYLDTQSQSVNTIELNIKFPPDKLQLVSSSTGKSIIGIWTSLPKYNNENGTIYLVGGIPGGVNVSRGLISTFTFRVRAVGSAVVKFENSRVLLNDGLGTEVLTNNYNSIYSLELPPPAGPIVISETHPDQTQWYRHQNASLRWEGVSAGASFSYILNDKPVDVPDDISEGTNRSVNYSNLSEGRHYFHIRSYEGGHWGGTTHYALNVDPNPPAEFKTEFSPSARTTKTQPVVQFATTDTASGLDHYEIRIIPLNKITNGDDSGLFIEAQSPYIAQPLELGKYDVIVRAYDKAGNVRESVERLEIVTAVFKVISGQGLEVRSWFILPWYLLLALLLILILFLIWISHRMHLWHRMLSHKHATVELPNTLQQQMEELQKYRAKYGKLSAIILLIGLSLFSLKNISYAQEQILSPPLVTTVAQNISDQDIFYIGGETGAAGSEVVIYLQNLESSATISEIVVADKKGEWFYRHDTFLSPGKYLLWTQAKSGSQLSPPSPQVTMNVETTAISFGGSRISYVTLYMILTLTFAGVALLLMIYIIRKFLHGRRKHQLIMSQIMSAESSIRSGFAVLSRDLEAELAVIRQAKLSKQLSEEEKRRETQLIADMKDIEERLGKEVWDIQETETRL